MPGNVNKTLPITHSLEKFEDDDGGHDDDGDDDDDVEEDTDGGDLNV